MTDQTTAPATRFRPPPVSAVRLDGFWGERIATVRTVTAPILRRRCEEAGMLEQVDPDRPVPAQRIPFHHGTVTTQMFWDSDLAKTIETAAYCMLQRHDPALEASCDELIAMFERLQLPDGYLNSWFTRMQPGLRWTNMRDCHELYCLGHLIEAAVAYADATGKTALRDIVVRALEHVAAVIGREPGQKPGYPGHQEIELALVRLHRQTGDARHLALARYFIDERGREPKYFERESHARGEAEDGWWHGTAEYNQWHRPVREQDKVVGHAVRAMYMYSGMADVAAETGDPTLVAALDRLWDDLNGKRLYVTGGLGPSEHNEGFTADYALPNDTAYAETCAAVGLVFWASRMLTLRPDRRYGDVLERALYNGALVGLSRDGERFFYDNPLATDGTHRRWTWHKCPCCPPNLARLIASLGSYGYAESPDGLAVHLYGEGEARLHAADTEVILRQDTRFPWDGDVLLTVSPAAPARFALLLRIPGWCRAPTLAVNGDAVALDGAGLRDGYARIERRWSAGDTVRLALPMRPEFLYADPRVAADAGLVALRRGPLVYCVEACDNGAELQRWSLRNDATLADRFEPDLLGGVVTVAIGARRDRLPEPAYDGIYGATPPATEPGTLRAVPYYAWDNRDGGAMRVWLRRAVATTVA